MTFAPKLSRDERGAVMLVTIFMMLFLVAMLYMVIGVGKTLIMKEGMQDAADAAAYSSAIFNARGMNLIVFINMLMAALIAILIAIRVAQTLLLIGAAFAGAAAWMGGSTAFLATELTRQAMDMQNHFTNAKKKIEPVLEGLHSTQEAISVVVPWVGMVKGMTEAATHHRPATGAFAVPGSTSLPVESDDFSRLCEKGATFVVDLALAPVPKSARGYVSDSAESIAGSTSGFLCGDGKGAPPSHTETLDVHLPRHPAQRECDRDPGSRACERIVEDGELVVPDDWSGECLRDCGYHGVYETNARRARVACDGLGGMYKEFLWQECVVDVRYRFDGAEWVEESHEGERCRIKTNKVLPPCGRQGTVSEDEWNTDSGPEDADEPDPVCESEPEGLPKKAAIGSVRGAKVTEARRIFSCVYEDTRTYSLAEPGDAMGGSGSEKKSPHRVEEDLELGDEAFQIRAIAFGDKPGPGHALDGVKLAARGQDVDAKDEEMGTRVADTLRELGRLSVAQSEYYFEGKEEPTEWMWQMKWTARLKHFRLPDDEEKNENDERNEKKASSVAAKRGAYGGIKPEQTASDSCRASGGSKCADTVAGLSLFDSLVRH